MTKRGIITVISAPSGCGKNTLIEEASKYSNNLAYVTSATTREIRVGEAEGVNYFYKTEEEFERLIETGEILEWDSFCNCKYLFSCFVDNASPKLREKFLVPIKLIFIKHSQKTLAI